VSNHALIAVVHSTPASIAPTRAAFAAELPDGRVWNLLDDRLGPDAEALSVVTPRLRDQMLDLIRHGITGGADAVLIACSMYGDTVDVAEKLFTVPVFSSDADMMSEIARIAPRRVAVLASLHTAASDTTARLTAYLATHDDDIEVVPVYCDGAGAAAAAHDIPAVVEALTSALDATPGRFDMLCIAQYSLSPVHDDVAAKTGIPVVSPPRFAARAVAQKLRCS
jgi:hypothetical protein